MVIVTHVPGSLLFQTQQLHEIIIHYLNYSFIQITMYAKLIQLEYKLNMFDCCFLFTCGRLPHSLLLNITFGRHCYKLSFQNSFKV